MNEIKIKVKFKKGLCYSQGINLVKNDYNSTKLVFEFDETEGTKIFEMKDPDDNVVFADEIVNNELILARFDGNNNAYPIFTKAGKYTYEISLYKDNSKLTSVADKLKVTEEQVVIDGEIVQTYTPMFDNLLSDLSSALQETDNLDIDVSKSGNVATVTITKKDGTEESVEISDGQNGQSGRDGRDGADATINGVSALTVEAGENITLEQEGSTLIINSESGTLDYPELTNKPSINNVTLNGNKTSSDLGLQPAGNYVTDTDYATEIKAGLVRIDPEFLAFVQETGILCALSVSYNSYGNMYGSAFISKGTLENVITGKNLYSKPNGGIPKTDLASTVQTSLNKADTAIQEHQDISGKEDKTNKVTSIDNTSTDTQYPSAKCVHDSQANQDDEIEALQTENERLKATLPTTTGEGQDITLDKTAEMEFVKPPLPRGNTKQNTTTGKNLLNTSNANTTTVNGVTSYRNNGFYYLSGTNTKTDATWILPNTQNTNLPVFEIGQTYTMSFKGTIPNGIYAQLNGVKASTGTQYSIGSVRNTVPSVTFTIDSDYSSTAQLFICIQGATTNADCNFAIQIEKGSTATSYESYTGGIPSPNPSYPQEVEVVTGNVEVTISNENNTESKTLPVSLGNIELCKIGNYQDYLYKDNGKWYVHKNTIKIDLSTITSYTHTSGWRNPTAFVADGVFYHEYSGYTTVASLFCNRLIADTPARITGSIVNAIGLGRNSSIYISVEGITTSNALITYFSQNPTYLYAPLATPTSTEITDVTLISQLEEISKTLSYQGQTNITSNTIALFDVEAYQSTKLILENLDSRLTLVEG